jgi:2-polyprenyl-3-methyl-5-hydroxy-6-metoxy-1,4-benzoquinol methylase
MAIQHKELLNWSHTSHDYSLHRQGYPDDFFQLLPHLGIGLPGQNILDIGAGTGVLAIPFARQGAHVTAVDISPGQIAAARDRAEQENLDINFIVSGAEDILVEQGHFHAVTASMCWGYLDKKRIVELVKRVLRKDGLLLLSSSSWISDHNEISRQTVELIGSYFPGFESRGTAPGVRDIRPEWSRNDFQVRTFHQYVGNIPFTHESWRGRIRASKWVGAALSQDKVEAFDRDLAAILEKIAPETFEIAHNITVQIFERVPLR